MVKIYMLEKNNIPFYIGKAKNPIRRKHKHRIKYGEDIALTIIDEVREDEWKFWECYWIEQFKGWGFILENKNKGGGGPTKWTNEQKEKINPSRIKKIKSHPTRGNKISNSLQNHSQYYTKEVRQKMSYLQKGKPKPFSKEHIKNMGIAKRKQAKSVLQYDLEGNFIKEWESKGQAAEWLKEQTGKTSNLTSQIKDCILGRQKTAIGYKWKYKDN